MLPSGKCAIQFSESLKEDKYFLPFLRDAIGEDTNLKNIADEFPWMSRVWHLILFEFLIKCDENGSKKNERALARKIG